MPRWWGKVYQGMKRHDTTHWTAHVIRHTIVSAIVVMLSAVAAGYALQRIAPEAEVFVDRRGMAAYAGPMTSILIALALAASAIQAPARPEATSLLGKPLVPAPISAEARKALEENFKKAEIEYGKNPDDPDATIWLGRRQAYLGRIATRSRPSATESRSTPTTRGCFAIAAIATSRSGSFRGRLRT